MTLGELFQNICSVPDGLSDRTVTGVTSDSREVAEGFVFVCIKGASFDGHSVAERMLEKGAAAVVTQERLGLDSEINVENSRRLYPELLSAFCGRPTKNIALGAVTGTNGKTTTVNLCAQIMRYYGKQTGTIGTLGCDTGKGLEYSHDGPPTTPEPRKLYQLFGEMSDIGTELCFLEASSQALAQYRFAAEDFAVAAFTNLTRDHLDYHGTMEEYYLAKRSLFDMARCAVVNIDDEYGRRTADYCREKGIPLVTTSVYGEADVCTEMVRLLPDRAVVLISDHRAKKSYPVTLPMTGYYNVSNAIQAAVMCSEMGLSLGECFAALENGGGVSGRLETLYSGDFTVIRDYAHTGDGLEKLLSTLKPLVKGRLIVLFGAAGERDRGKRPEMGEIVAKYADYMIVTTDNPRFEDMQQTVDDVIKGIPDGVPFHGETDRLVAIHSALSMAQTGDLVALCGKGHEDYQAINGTDFPFDEREIVLEWINTNKKQV